MDGGQPLSEVLSHPALAPGGPAPRVAYLAHDLSDQGVVRRVRMLHVAGAEVRLFGFRRTDQAIGEVDGAPAMDLGRSYDGALLQRALATGAQALLAAGWGADLRGCDVILARNLEMLTIAALARRLHAPRARLVYECLDVHRLMTSPGPAGVLLRRLERSLLAQTQALVVSSPAYVRAYFGPWQGLGARFDLPVVTLENRVFECVAPPAGWAVRPPGPPWRIGWFGILRCRQSFAELASLAAASQGRIEVVLAGRPSEREFPDFAAQVEAAPGMRFIGAYRPEDLARLYGGVHFNWAVDHFQAGGNSQWLLPNRLYEGGQSRVVPIALAGGETARWLQRRGLGVVVAQPVTELRRFFAHLDAPRYQALEQRCASAPKEWFVATPDTCRDLIHALAAA
ncbi:MAG TPA: glycosyl transferase family 1 [Caulobacteraceae bacterium]|nr:glycosyl transferase family 1 [Caulobacteraceae bacterium]